MAAPARSCTGPNGEPGWQGVAGDQVSACFTYDPADVMSKVRAERQLIDWLKDRAAENEAEGLPVSP